MSYIYKKKQAQIKANRDNRPYAVIRTVKNTYSIIPLDDIKYLWLAKVITKVYPTQ